MAKKSRDRSNTTRPAPAVARKSKDGGNDNQAVNPTDESCQPPRIRPQRRNLPLLILSIVLLIAWLVVMLAIAVNK